MNDKYLTSFDPDKNLASYERFDLWPIGLGYLYSGILGPGSATFYSEMYKGVVYL